MDKHLVFKNPPPITRADAEKKISEGNPELRAEALLSLALHESDWRWVQNLCIQYVNDNHPNTQRVALLCLGHLARLHGTIDKDKVFPILNGLLDDPVLGGTAEDVLEDIGIFVK